MSWGRSATDSSVYERPLGPIEAGMVSAVTAKKPSPREHIKIYTIVHFSASQTVERVIQAFQEAWKALRLLKSPDIATTFDEVNKYYQVPNPQQLEAWLEQTFWVARPGTSIKSAIKSMQSRKEYLPICEIIYEQAQAGSFKGSLILYVSHWRTEAGGCLMMVDQLFTYAADLLHSAITRKELAEHANGSEIQLLTPTIEEMLMPNEQSSPEAKTRVQKRFDDWLLKLPCVDYSTRGEIDTEPLDFEILQRTYTPASTAELVAACRKNGVTVTAAIHAAFLSGVWADAHPERAQRSWTCTMPAEVRKRLPPASPFRNQGCWSAAQMLLLHAPAGESFLATATNLKSQYTVAAQDSWLRQEMRETTDQLIQSGEKMQAEQPISIPWFTSLGVLDSVLSAEHGDLKMNFVTAWADSIVPGIVLRMWTFKERLNIHIAWNEAFHSEAQIRSTMDIIEKTVASELAVQLVIEGVTGVDGL